MPETFSLDCALCLLRAEDPRPAITVLHGTAMCDLDLRDVGRKIVAARRWDSSTRAGDRAIADEIHHAAIAGEHKRDSDG